MVGEVKARKMECGGVEVGEHDLETGTQWAPVLSVGWSSGKGLENNAV